MGLCGGGSPLCATPQIMFADLYGKKAAALYTQAGDYQKTARFCPPSFTQQWLISPHGFPGCAQPHAQAKFLESRNRQSGAHGSAAVVGRVADLAWLPGQLLLQEGGGHVLPGQQLGCVRRLAPRSRPVGLLLLPCVPPLRAAPQLLTSPPTEEWLQGAGSHGGGSALSGLPLYLGEDLLGFSQGIQRDSAWYANIV